MKKAVFPPMSQDVLNRPSIVLFRPMMEGDGPPEACRRASSDVLKRGALPFMLQDMHQVAPELDFDFTPVFSMKALVSVATNCDCIFGYHW